MFKYVIECWNPERNKYVRFWEGNSSKMAETMFNKSYYSRNTRRLLSIETVIVKFEKKRKDNFLFRR